jgi:hypothetical protein
MAAVLHWRGLAWTHRILLAHLLLLNLQRIDSPLVLALVQTEEPSQDVVHLVTSCASARRHSMLGGRMQHTRRQVATCFVQIDVALLHLPSNTDVLTLPHRTCALWLRSGWLAVSVPVPELEGSIATLMMYEAKFQRCCCNPCTILAQSLHASALDRCKP